MLKAYKYRIYPTGEQQQYLAKVFGCVRFIYNKMLADKIEHYKKTETMLKNTPATYKKEFDWLKEVDSLALANAQLNLDKGIRISSVIRALGSRNSRARRRTGTVIQRIIRRARSAWKAITSSFLS